MIYPLPLSLLCIPPHSKSQTKKEIQKPSKIKTQYKYQLPIHRHTLQENVKNKCYLIAYTGRNNNRRKPATGTSTSTHPSVLFTIITSTEKSTQKPTFRLLYNFWRGIEIGWTGVSEKIRQGISCGRSCADGIPWCCSRSNAAYGCLRYDRSDIVDVVKRTNTALS